MRIESEIVNAIQQRDFEKAKALLQSGEKISKEVIKQPNFSLPFDQLIQAKQYEIIDLLVADKTIETDIYEYDSFRNTIFDVIIRRLPVDEESLNFLTDFVGKLQNINDDIQNETLLGYALENTADIAIIKCLINAGCDVNYINNAEQSLLYQVLNKRMAPAEKTMAYMETLISEGLDVNKANVEKTTPIMVAVSQNKPEYLDLLLENGADPNEQDWHGETAFYKAVVDQGSVTVYDKLAAHVTPDFDLRDQRGNTLLLAYLSRPISDYYPAILPKLIEAGADLRQTALHYDQEKSGLDWLAEKSFESLETVLAMDKIELNEPDDKGETLLHKVCAYNVVLDERMAKEIYKKAKLLIESGADVNLINRKEETPLMLASNNNLKAKTVQLLISNSAK